MVALFDDVQRVTQSTNFNRCFAQLRVQNVALTSHFLLLYRIVHHHLYTSATRTFSFFCYARQHICYSAYMPREFRPSVCPSVTRMYCIKTAECIMEILSPSDRPIILVFRHQGSLRKSDGFTRGLCGYTRTRGFYCTRPVPAGTSRVGYELHEYGSGTGTELGVRVRAGIPALLAKILPCLPNLPHVV